MKLSVYLANWNNRGLVAYMTNQSDDFDDKCKLVLRKNSQNHKEICLEAARKLRIAAIRFELLAEEEKPCHEATHRKIARMKVELPGATT